MLQMRDTETGLSLTLSVQSKPRNPRLFEENLFEIVTWTPGLGDPHDWQNAVHLMEVVSPKTFTIFPLRRVRTARDSFLVMERDRNASVHGYAIASHDLLKLEFEVDEITAEVTARAEDACLVELQTFEEYVAGNVFGFTITDRSGDVLEERGHIYGQEYAEHLAQTAFGQHRMSIQIDG